MAKCPNCGRKTQRTDDWACQWCGYPLLSGGYKKMEKTFHELKEETAYKPEASEEEEVEEIPPAPVKTTRARQPELEPEREPEPEPKAEPAPEPEPEVIVEPPPQPRAVPPLEPAPPPPPEPELQPAPAPAPPPVVEPAPPPRPNPILTLETIPDGLEVTTEEISSAYQADKAAAHTKLTNKTLKVTGIADKIFVKEHLDIQYILLTTAERGDMWNVRGTFDKKLAYQLRRLTPGERLTIQGRYNGYERNIILKDCVLVR